MRIMVAGGGTGGHIYPTLAVVEKLEEKGIKDIVYVGSISGMEIKIIPQLGLNFYFVHAGKFRRYHSNFLINILNPTTLIQNFLDVFKVARGFFESRAILKEFQPDLVFVKGGFVGVPIGLAAASLKLPLIIHESDSVMGLANRVLSKYASKVMVSYPENYYKNIDRDKLVYTGNPIREEILKGNKEEAKKVFNLKNKEPVILVVGGSQGSHFINSIIAESLEILLFKYQIIHVCGDEDLSWLVYLKSQLPVEIKNKYNVHSYLSNELKEAYAVADLLISRAGQNFISEFTALGKPMLLIPYGPGGAHQHRNAQIISRFGAAYSLLETDLSSEVFVDQINIMFEKPGELDFMAKKSREFGKKNAADLMAEVIIDFVNENKKDQKMEK